MHFSEKLKLYLKFSSFTIYILSLKKYKNEDFIDRPVKF